MASRILVVDDEPAIAALLRRYLEAEGFQVAVRDSSTDTLADVARIDPDLVLLDIGLPDGSGFDVLTNLRASSDVSVIMVTARAEEVDKLLALGHGADDYVTKPFSPREVVARVKTVLRRANPKPLHPHDEVLCFPGLTIDPARREVDGRWCCGGTVRPGL